MGRIEDEDSSPEGQGMPSADPVDLYVPVRGRPSLDDTCQLLGYEHRARERGFPTLSRALQAL